MGVADEEFGQRLKAFVVARNGAKLTERGGPGLRQEEPRPLQGAPRGGVPEELPRNATGKVVKRELVEQSQLQGSASAHGR